VYFATENQRIKENGACMTGIFTVAFTLTVVFLLHLGGCLQYLPSKFKAATYTAMQLIYIIPRFFFLFPVQSC